MLQNRYRLLLRVSAVVAIIVCLKLVIHSFGWEVISVNALFSGIIAANVFLMGLLLNGVLSDFKESERLPGELAASMENLAQEVRCVGIADAAADVTPCLTLLWQLSQNILLWFHKQYRTGELLGMLNDLTPQFAAIEKWAQATLVGRLMQEQSNLRRSIIRIHTIRETSFVSSGYLLADIITFFVCLGLILAKMEWFSESFFFVTIISYFMVFLLFLIRDLDNPFGHYQRSSGEDVSLKPVEDVVRRLGQIAGAEPTS